MNGAHWHLAVNHLPIVFPLVGLLVMLTALFLKSAAVRRTAYFIFILGALATLAAMSTGEGAEEVVEEISGVSEDYIEHHEEVAETFALLSYLLGALSLVAVWADWKQKKIARLLAIITCIFTLVILFYAKETGTSGGEIRHTEIRTTTEHPHDSASADKSEETHQH